MKAHCREYVDKISNAFTDDIIDKIEILASALKDAWVTGKKVFLCGNGGSAGNAIHLANDFNYGIDKANGIGLYVDALPANQSIVTCLANDEGYDSIYSQQLKVRASKDDILIVLSGSGNSPNVVKALEVGNAIGMNTFSILGFSGGKCKELSKTAIHFPINDMQVSEDLQTMIGHMCMQKLSKEPPVRN